jgi:hypothetical protein
MLIFRYWKKVHQNIMTLKQSNVCLHKFNKFRVQSCLRTRYKQNCALSQCSGFMNCRSYKVSAHTQLAQFRCEGHFVVSWIC